MVVQALNTTTKFVFHLIFFLIIIFMKIAFDYKIFWNQRYGGISRYFINIFKIALSDYTIEKRVTHGVLEAILYRRNKILNDE